MALLSAQRKTVALAPPIPIRNEVFDQHRLVLRQGQLTILAAAPSVGKSVFARNLVAKTPVSSLYFSADSDEYTVKTSVTGALSGEKMVDIERHLSEDPAWEPHYAAILHKADHVEWKFSPDINLGYIELQLEAFGELYGEFPKLVVIDNLGDLVTEEQEEYAELRAICRDLRKFARYSNAHFIALHHTKGPFEDGTKPITLSALLGNLGKVPETVLGLHWSDFTQQNVSLTVPKARGSKRGMTLPLRFDYETGSVSDFYGWA